MAANEAQSAVRIAARSGWCMISLAFREHGILEPETGSRVGCRGGATYACGGGISLAIGREATLQAAWRS
jgi:hypothetical protein